MTYTFMCGVVSLASVSGIPKKFLVGPMRTWDQKFTPGLMLLPFMTVHLFQFRIADVVDAKTNGGNCPGHDSSRTRYSRSLIY